MSTKTSLSSNPLGHTGISFEQNPPFINANRAPTTNDLPNYVLGTQWADSSVVPPALYVSDGTSWQSGGNKQATTAIAGITRYATTAEVNAGTGTNNAALAADVFNLAQSIVVGAVPAATETTSGISKISTTALTQAYTDNATNISPLHLADGFAAPPTAGYGSTTPRPVVATTLGFTTATGTVGGTWATGGQAIAIGADATTDAISIAGTGSGARTVHVADAAAAMTVTVGSATTTSALTLQAGSGNFTLTTGTATVVTMGAAMTTGTWALGGTAATGNMIIGSSSQTNLIAVGNGAGTTTLNLVNSGANNILNVGASMVGGTIVIGGTSATGTITLGSSSASNTQIIAGGSGATTLQIADVQVGGSVSVGAGMTSGTITIGGTAQTGASTITLGSSSATSTVLIANGAGASTVTVAGGTAGANVVNICNSATAATNTVNILSGAGSAGGGALNMANNGRVTTISLANVLPAAARTTTVCGGNQAQNDSLLILNGDATANTQTCQILSGVGSGTHAKSLNLCNTTMSAGTATVNIMSAAASGGTLAVNIVGDGATTTVVTTKIATGAAAHVLTIGNAASGAQTWNVGTGNLSIVGGGNTIGIGNDAAVANTIAIGGTGANVITIGNTQTTGSITIGNALTSGPFILGGTAGTADITLGRSTSGQIVKIGGGVNTGTSGVQIANGAVASGTTTVNILNGNSAGGTLVCNILGSTAATTAGTVNIGTGAVAAASHAINIGNVLGSMAIAAPTTLTLASGASIGLVVDTSAGTGIAATFESVNVSTPDVSLLKGGLLVTPVVVGAGGSPQVCSGRHGFVTFSGVSIAGGADQTLTITNTLVTAGSHIMVTMSGATTGSAPTIKAVTPGAGTFNVVVTNGTGLSTTTANIVFVFWVLD